MATSINSSYPLVVGLNWGAAQDSQYENQTEYPSSAWGLCYNDLGSFKRAYHMFEDSESGYDKYGRPEHFSQTNFNFFRTKRGIELNDDDMELCLPIFIILNVNKNYAL